MLETTTTPSSADDRFFSLTFRMDFLDLEKEKMRTNNIFVALFASDDAG
jgi:hypothetical protein